MKMLKLKLWLLFAAVAVLSCGQPPSPPPPDAPPPTDAAPTAPSLDPRTVAAGDMVKINEEQRQAEIKLFLAAQARKPSPPIPRASQVADLARYQQHIAKTAAAPGLFAAGQPTIFPKSWSVTAWYYDNQNITTLASDNNDCQTITTPCLTFAEIVYNRWGTPFPALGGVNNVNFIAQIFQLSTGTNADAVIAAPISGVAEFIGPLNATTQIATGTLASVIAKNASSDQVLTATLAACSGVCQPGMLIHNTTHDSYAWTNTNVSGNVWQISQPMTVFAQAEVDTWTSGDTYFVYNLLFQSVSQLNNNTTVQFLAPNGGSFGSFLAARAFSESSLNTALGQPTIQTFANCNNCDLPVSSTVWNGGQFVLTAGQYRGLNNLQGAMSVSNDFLSSGLLVIPREHSTLSKVWLQNSGMITIGFVTMSNYIAGNSKIQIQPGSVLSYGLATGLTATQLFLSTAGVPLQFNHVGSVATGYSVFTSGTTATLCGGIALTPTNLDKSVSATCATTGFGGNAFLPGAGAINNF